MNPDTCNDAEDAGDESPANWPLFKPGRPYGVYPAPPNLVRAPGTPMEADAVPPSAPPAVPATTPSAAPPAFAADAASPACAKPEDLRSGEGRAGPRPAVPAASPAVAAPAAPSPETPLSRRRHELFCQYFVLYGSASRAAMEAGYSVLACKNQGYRLLRRPEVKARIADIHRRLARDFNRDTEVLLGKLEAVYRRAVDGGYLNAAARIVELQARMAGLAVPRAKAPAGAADPGSAEGFAEARAATQGRRPVED